MLFVGKKTVAIKYDSEVLTFVLEVDYDIESRQPFIESASLSSRDGRPTLEHESELWFASLGPVGTRTVWDRLYRTLDA